MKYFFYKNSNRLSRGKLQKFEDLPDFAKENFKIIKIYLKKFLNKDVKVYVKGSFYWGFWNENSDYDVSLNEYINEKEFKNFILQYINIKVDILPLVSEIDSVEIP
jgi:hypothetical protein